MVGIMWAFFVVCLVVAFWRSMMHYKELAVEDEVDVDVAIDQSVAERRRKRDEWLKSRMEADEELNSLSREEEGE